ncbi:MAG: EamA family transporter [Alphaproteobacteria bacterium]|nr:EamA family transporter [Alphaproteobacteria bacterium]
MPNSHKTRATLTGLLTILIWSTLAILGVLVGNIPPFQLVAMAFTVVFTLIVTIWLLRGEKPWTHFKLPASAWTLGVTGLFGYHLLYFVGIQNAPPADANLINYLWPVLIVLFSALLPARSEVGALRWFHVTGAGLGFLGTALIIAGGTGLSFNSNHTYGYAAAIGAALLWASYSVLSRRFAHISTNAVGSFCGATALLAWLAHFAIEPTIWPTDTEAWLAVLAIGLGPVGFAFFFWDHAVKHGDLRVIGATAYAAPVLSTLLLVMFGFTAPTWTLALACALVTGGGLLAARDLIAGRS